MKKWICLGCLAGLAGAWAAEPSYTGFTCDSVPVLPEKEVHPSLWFRKADVAALRAKRGRDGLASNLWKQVVSSKFLTMDFPPVPSADDGKRTIHGYYGSMSQIAKYAGFMIWMTDDPAQKKRWIDRATAALERAYDGPIDRLDPMVKGSPVDEIYMGTWLQNYAAAYDWTQPFLAPGKDKAIRARLAAQNERVATHLFDWASRPHNHLSKPAWGVGSMALALSDESRAMGWLGTALAAANANTAYFFSADGIYREGSHYLLFSWVNFLPFMYNYYHVSGVNQFADFQPLMEWGVAVRNGKGWLPNIEDAFIRPFPAHMAAAMYTNSPTWLNSSAPLAEVMTWAYKTTDLSPFDASLKKTGFNYTGATWDYTLPLDEYLTYDPSIKATPPDCSPTVFLKGGQSIFRNSWATGDPSVRYLLFQGVAEADNHNHADQLSFILFAENQMMASDAGYCRKSYSEPSRKQWYIQPQAHNVVTLDGQPPVDAAESATPLSRYRIDTDFFDFEEKDEPYPNGGRLRRAVAFPGEEYFVVADIVASPAKAEAVLYLHGGRGTMDGAGTSRVWNLSADAYGPAAKLHAWVFGADSIADRMGEITYLKGDYHAFPYIAAKATGRERTFLQILFPAAPGKKSPEVASEKSGNQIWATLKDGDTHDTFLVQPSAGAAAFQGLETDGTFCWVREKAGGVVSFAVREATYLRKGEETLFQSSEPQTKAVQR